MTLQDGIRTDAGAMTSLDPSEAIRVRDDHHCFGCGRLNPFGLQMSFYAHEGGVMSPFLPERRHEGYTGVVHGGIVTTVLDEVMAWALYANGIWAVTGDLHVRFRRPVEVGSATRATGFLVRDRGRIVEVGGVLRREEDGGLLAEATASFVRVPEAQSAAWRARYLDPDPGRIDKPGTYPKQSRTGRTPDHEFV